MFNVEGRGEGLEKLTADYSDWGEGGELRLGGEAEGSAAAPEGFDRDRDGSCHGQRGRRVLGWRKGEWGLGVRAWGGLGACGGGRGGA